MSFERRSWDFKGWEREMARKTSGPDGISEKLHEAINGLRKDVTRVEIWATALGSFAQPVPDYQLDENFRLVKASKSGPK